MKRKKRTLLGELAAIPTGACIFFIAVGLILGSVFIIGKTNIGEFIEMETAVSESAVYVSHIIHVGRHSSVQEVELFFEGREPLYIGGECYNERLGDALEALNGGERLDMLLNPRTGLVLEVRYGGHTLLDFEDSTDGMRFESIGFAILGGFCYLYAVVGVASLVIRVVKRKRAASEK